LAGENTQNYDIAVLAALTEFLPAGTSTRTVRHFAQLFTAVDGKFQKYDFGRDQNLLTYGHDKPPSYDLSTITIPIGIFYSDSDGIATGKDLERALRELKVPIGLFNVKAKKFGHNEFTLGTRAHELVNNPLIKLLADLR
jgi:hypothetical protein